MKPEECPAGESCRRVECPPGCDKRIATEVREVFAEVGGTIPALGDVVPSGDHGSVPPRAKQGGDRKGWAVSIIDGPKHVAAEREQAPPPQTSRTWTQ